MSNTTSKETIKILIEKSEDVFSATASDEVGVIVRVNANGRGLPYGR